MSKYPLCPFYQFEDKRQLFCEGTTIEFPDRVERGTWMQRHCCSWDFKICNFYRKVMKKYGE